MAFAVCCAAALRRPHSGRVRRINEIQVERGVNASRVARRYLDSFFDDPRHAPLIKLAHREYANSKFLDKLALARINAARPDDSSIFRQYLWRESRDVSQLAEAITEQGGKRHPMYVSRRGRLRRIHVRVRVKPNDS